MFLKMFQPFFLNHSILEIYRPYFKFKRENLKELIWIALIIAGNIFQAGMTIAINVAFTHFFGMLSLPGLTYTQLFTSIAQFLFTVMVYAASSAMNEGLAYSLIDRLDYRIASNYFTRWISSKANYGINFLKGKSSNPEIIIGQDIGNANELLITMSNNYINAFFSFLAGLYGLWQLSMPLSITVASMIFVVPGYMVIAALIYSITYNIAINLVSGPLYNTVKNQEKLINKLSMDIQHVAKHAEQIDLLQGAKKERRNIIHIMKNSRVYNAQLNRLRMSISGLNALNAELQLFVGIILSTPQIIAKTISVDNIYFVGSYFSQIVSFFTWRKDNTNDLIRLDVLTDKIVALKADIKQWEEIKKADNFSITYAHKENSLSIRSLIVRKPMGTILIDQKEFDFKKGVTIIQGPSGAGKTTLFRALTGLWPFVEGEITFPVKSAEYHVIPQRPYFPIKSSLYDALLYPREGSVTEKEKERIIYLMRKAELEEETIADLEKVEDWSSVLSGGEQQRIAIIRAILHNPRLLLMDEPFSAMDPKLKPTMESILKEELTEAYIIYIDHHVLSEEPAPTITALYDHRVILKNSQLAAAPDNELFERQALKFG